VKHRAGLLVLLLSGWSQLVFALEADSALRVGEFQRYCHAANECALVYTRCDSCECGVALNESFAAAHNRNLEALCSSNEGASYKRAHCDKVCAPAKPMCVMGLCIMQPSHSL
jgi:hypothetical protein